MLHCININEDIQFLKLTNLCRSFSHRIFVNSKNKKITKICLDENYLILNKLKTLRKHAYIMLIPLNPTFI